MEELVTKASTRSSACWQAMEEMARRHVQQWLQGLLDDEVTQFLGRARYRRDEGERGYRNGYGKPRQLTTRAGTVTVRRPWVRGLEQRFESALLPLFASCQRPRSGRWESRDLVSGNCRGTVTIPGLRGLPTSGE